MPAQIGRDGIRMRKVSRTECSRAELKAVHSHGTERQRNEHDPWRAQQRNANGKDAHFKTIAASFISTMKVDSPVMMLSLAPIRVKMRSVGESLPDKNTLSGTVRNQQTLDERGLRAALHLTGSLTRGRSSRAAPEWSRPPSGGVAWICRPCWGR